MITFTHEYSSFPEKVIETRHFKDVDDSIAAIVNTIKTLQAKGLYEEAADIIARNKATLKHYIIDTALINELIEHIRNTEIYALTARQSIYTTDTEPYACLNGDVWIGGV